MTLDREAFGTGVKTGGKVVWDDPQGFTDALKMMPDGSVIVKVELASQKAIRSIKANRYYFGCVLDLMAKDTQQDKDDIHDAMCDRFLKRKVFMVNRHTGEAEEREVARRSSKLNADEFYAFVENVRLFAAEFLGLTIPDPDPEYWRRRSEAA